jgi:hypothetical protein
VLSAQHDWWLLLIAVAMLATPVLAEDDRAPALTLNPSFVRCQIAAGEGRALATTLVSSRPATLLAAEADCRCISLATPLPAGLPAGKPVPLTIHVTATQPGVKTLTLRTTAGSVAINIQVVTAGLGQGRDQVENVLKAAAAAQGQIWFVVKDLRGEIRNCGCSDGSLGGMDHLAALPQLCKELSPNTRPRFILVGDTEGMRTGVAAALAQRGWEQSPPDVLASARPEIDITKNEVIAVVPEVPVAINHAKLVRIPLDGGVLMAALLVVEGRVREQHLVAVDRSLASEASILTTFAGTLSRRLDASACPSTSCLACHQQAHAIWATSAHARAWASLAELDRVDACASCHSTPVAPQIIAAGVHCQACHHGADAHAAAPATVRTTGVTDCRACHDERRHPTFDRESAWALIQHGK